MVGLIIWKNQEINRLRRDMDRLFTRLRDDFGVPLFPRQTRQLPLLDLSETEETLILKAELPGVNPDDIEISINENILSIRGEMKQEPAENDKGYHRMERRYGSFARNLQLPCKISIDEVDAVYKKGVLTIVMPKCKAEKPRDVRIQVK